MALTRSQFTYDYAQPDAYHFCQDSVIFPKHVAEALVHREVSPEFRVLDVCSGCGVIGFELAHHDSRLTQVDFMEIQDEFRPAFEQNLTITKRQHSTFRFLNESFENLTQPAKSGIYDLIVGNPPFFLLGEGWLSPSLTQNRCRFFIDGSLRQLIVGVANALKVGGEAFLLVKSGQKHGRDTDRDMRLWLAGAQFQDTSNGGAARILAEWIGDVRGTPVLNLRKL